MTITHTPPQDRQAERAVLGSILVNPSLLASVELSPADFSSEGHAKLFRAMLEMDAAGEAIDPVTLRDRLQADKEQALYITSLVASDAFTPSNLAEYAGIVSRTAIQRRIIEAGTRIATLGREKEPEEASAEAWELLFAATNTRQRKSRSLRELIDERMATVTAKREYVSVPGFSGLHVCPGDLVVIGGRRGTGKTAFALHLLAEGWASHSPVAFYSYEMTAEQLADRVIARHGNLSVEGLEEGLPEFAVPALAENVEPARSLHLSVKEAAGFSQSELFASLRRFAAGGGKVAVIDYLQLAADWGNHGRTTDITRFTNELKRVALDTHLVVVALSQFHRTDEDKISLPTLGWFRESGSIENDANTCVLLYAYPDPRRNDDSRKAVEKLAHDNNLDFDVTAWVNEWVRNDEHKRRVVMVDFAKVRQGRERSWPFLFDGSRMHWEPIPEIREVTWKELGE